VSRLQLVPDIVTKGDNKLRKRIETAMTDALEELSMTRVEEAMGGGLDEEPASTTPKTAAPGVRCRGTRLSCRTAEIGSVAAMHEHCDSNVRFSRLSARKADRPLTAKRRRRKEAPNAQDPVPIAQIAS
jgi:hypothetical protein